MAELYGGAKIPVLPNDVLLVGFDFTHGEDNRLLIVAQKEGEMFTVVNAFEGDDAWAMFLALVTKKKRDENES